MLCAAYDHKLCVAYVQKNFYIQIFINQSLTKYHILMKLPQISHIHKNHIFKSIIGIFRATPSSL